MTCAGCGRRVICESRPTPLAESLSTVHELRDRWPVMVRPLLYSDRFELALGYQRLSPEARRLRFFVAPEALSGADLEYLANLDYRDHFAWASFALDEPGWPGAGVARYIRDPARPTQAEAAVTVLSAYQHRGLGTLLLKMLADEARRHGIAVLVSHVLWDNVEALRALAGAGADVRITAEEPGVARVEIEIPHRQIVPPGRAPAPRTMGPVGDQAASIPQSS